MTHYRAGFDIDELQLVYQDRGKIYYAYQNSDKQWQKDRRIFSSPNFDCRQTATAHLYYYGYLRDEWNALVWDAYHTSSDVHYIKYCRIKNNGQVTSIQDAPMRAVGIEPHPAVSGYNSNLTYPEPSTVVAFRQNFLAPEGGPYLQLWYPEEGEEIGAVVVTSGSTADFPSLDNRKSKNTSDLPYYLLAWQEVNGIHYIPFSYTMSTHQTTFYPAVKRILNEEFNYLCDNIHPNLHSYTTEDNNNINVFVTWQGKVQTIETEEVSLKYPAVCLREKGINPPGWNLPLIIFATENWGDRNPVVTSWEELGIRNLAVVYQEQNGVLQVVKRQEGEWSGPYTLTDDGVNPALTTSSDTPFAAWTELQEAPYRVMTGDITLIEESVASPPHSRRLSFNLQNSLSGAGLLTMDADITLEMADPELVTAAGSKTIRFQYRDSLVTARNAFQTAAFLVKNGDARLSIPVTVHVQNFRYRVKEGEPSGDLPFFTVQLCNAATHQVLGQVNNYTTVQLSSYHQGNFALTDTFEMDLKSYTGLDLQVEGVTFLAKGDTSIGIAEVYDLRRTTISVREKILTIQDHEAVPSRFRLYQNYPNPFNPNTAIAFDLLRECRVMITIYDLAGRKVRSLWNSTLPAGSHRVEWPGDNDLGESVASGIYLYRITTGEFTAVRKMILMR